VILLLILGLCAMPFMLILYARFKGNPRTVNETIEDKVVLKIAVPKYNDKSPVAAEQLYSSLHGMGGGKGKSRDYFSLEIASGHYGIIFILVTSRKYKTFIENQFYAQYPEAQI